MIKGQFTLHHPHAGPLPDDYEVVGFACLTNGTGAGFLVERRETKHRIRDELTHVGPVRSGSLREFEDEEPGR